MKIAMFCEWYERKPDMTPDYDKPHNGTIIGENADDAMRQLKMFKENHNLAAYTIPQIVYIYDI